MKECRPLLGFYTVLNKEKDYTTNTVLTLCRSETPKQVLWQTVKTQYLHCLQRQKEIQIVFGNYNLWVTGYNFQNSK